MMTSPYHQNNPAPMPPPPQSAPYQHSGRDPVEQFAGTRMTGLFDKIRELEARITTLEVQMSQKV